MTEKQTDKKFELVYKPESAVFSGNQLKIIPTEPKYEPTKEKQRAAIKYLAAEYPQNEVRSILAKEVEFKDPGGNFESIACNLCGQSIEMENWQETMDDAFQNSFNDLTFSTPCCHQKTSLNDLDYTMPSGFSKYEIVIIDPEIKDTQETELIKDLNQILGQDMKLIWAKY